MAFGRCSLLSRVKILTTSLCPAELHVYKESTVYTVYVAFDMYIQKSNMLHRCAFRCSPLSRVKILTTSLCPAELHVYKESTVYTVYVAFDMHIQKSNMLHRCAFCTEETFRKDTLRIMGHSCRTHMPQACTDWWKPVTTVCHNNASLYTYIPMEFIRPRQSTVVRPCSGYAWQPPGLCKELFDHNEATVSVNALNGLDRRLSFLQGKHQDMGRAIVGRHA